MKTINIKLVFWILLLGLFYCFIFMIPNNQIIANAEEEYVIEYLDGVELYNNNIQTINATNGELNLITGSVYSL